MDVTALVPWRRDGCSERCVRWRATDRRWVEAHHAETHEQYGASTVMLARTRKDLPAVRTGPLVIDRAAAAVFVHGEAVRLSRLQYGVLRVLADNIGQIVTQDEILRTVWGPEYAIENGLRSKSCTNNFRHLLRVILGLIRQRLGDAGALVVTRHNLGLLLRQEPPL